MKTEWKRRKIAQLRDELDVLLGSEPSPATKHRVIPVEWHRVAVEPGDNAPARVDRERVCAKCEKWVYYDNGDVTFHCGCNAHWKWRDVPAAQPANTDDRPAETIPGDLKVMYRAHKLLPAGERFATPEFVNALIERTGRAETRIEVLEAALRGLLSFMWSEGYSDQSPAMKTAEEVGINGLDKR